VAEAAGTHLDIQQQMLKLKVTGMMTMIT